MDSGNRAVELVERLARLARLVGNDGRAHGLKPAQWEALRYLSRANRFSRTPRALAAYLGATKGTVSQTVMSLERAGLVEKAGNPADGRSVTLALSPTGRALLADDEIERLRRAADALPEQTLAGLEAGLAELLARRLAATGGRPFGICRSCRHFAADRDGPGRHFCGLLRQALDDADARQICVDQEAA